MPRSTWQSRVGGAMLALLVQAGLIAAAFLLPVRPVFHSRLIRQETVLWLRPLPRIASQPTTIDARGAPRASVVPKPDIVPPQTSSSLPAPGPDISALRAFGRALFGCAPERYDQLSPEDRAHCPKPGEGLAYQPPDLLGGPSHVKDNARWANALAHKQSPLFLPGGLLFPLVAAVAALDGSITERSSAFRDPEKWPSYVDPGKLMPNDLNDQERANEAYHRDHPMK
jgi:hypothetical protein